MGNYFRAARVPECEWLEWRFLKSPLRRYQFWGLDGAGQLAGFAVTHLICATDFGVLLMTCCQ